MNAVAVIIIGLKMGHEFYSMDISGFHDDHKKFLKDNLETIHEYSWMAGIESEETGDHYLSVRGDPRKIDEVVGQLLEKFEDTDHPAYAPSFRAVDPDEVNKWRRDSIRQAFIIKYEWTHPTLGIRAANKTYRLDFLVWNWKTEQWDDSSFDPRDRKYA